MKKQLILLLLLVCNVLSYAQTSYSCDQISSDVKKWNDICAVYKKDNVKWANAVKDAGLYNLNQDGSLEYVYIINASDTIDMTTVREKTFDYICYYFKMDNESRANMVTNSEGDGVFFQGKIKNIGYFDGLMETNHIHANITFNVKFKPNRIRFSVKIQDYQVLKLGTKGEVYENRTVYLNNTYPLYEKSDHKKSYSMAFVNANSNCMNYANKYVDYLNKNATVSSQTVDEDW